MKTFLVFCAILATAYGGVVPWTPEREASAHDLFRRYCSGRSDNGDNGDVSWFCKKAPFVIKDSKRHSHTIRPAGSDKEQIVFIEAPATDYQHDIRITGQLNTNSRSKIFVVPAVDRQSVSITDDVSVDSKSSKPSIFFLKDSPRSRSRSEPEPSFSEEVIRPEPEIREPEIREPEIRTRNPEGPTVFLLRNNPRSRDPSPSLPKSTPEGPSVLVLRGNPRSRDPSPSLPESTPEGPSVLVLRGNPRSRDPSPSPQEGTPEGPSVLVLRGNPRTPTNLPAPSPPSDGPEVVVLRSNPRNPSSDDGTAAQQNGPAIFIGRSNPKNIDQN